MARKMEQFANDARRESRPFHIAAILVGDITRDLVRRFEDAGTDRVAIMLRIISNVEERRRAIEAPWEPVIC